MAKICKDIVCGENYFFINGQGELVCRCKNSSEQIMDCCRDFDAVKDADCTHIVAADTEGNLFYIINDDGHWGRGVVVSGVMAENLFVQRELHDTMIYYVAGGGLYKICIGTGDGQPALLDEIQYRAMPFVCQNAVYYINKKDALCTNERKEICKGDDITHIFATAEYLCIKEKNRLELISTIDFDNRQSLTRRHKETAQCPVVVSAGETEILCWLDKNEVFFAKKENGLWCSLETIIMQNAERLGIYKFDGKYDLGCIRNGQICSFNMKA